MTKAIGIEDWSAVIREYCFEDAKTSQSEVTAGLYFVWTYIFTIVQQPCEFFGIDKEANTHPPSLATTHLCCIIVLLCFHLLLAHLRCCGIQLSFWDFWTFLPSLPLSVSLFLSLFLSVHLSLSLAILTFFSLFSTHSLSLILSPSLSFSFSSFSHPTLLLSFLFPSPSRSPCSQQSHSSRSLPSPKWWIFPDICSPEGCFRQGELDWADPDALDAQNVRDCSRTLLLWDAMLHTRQSGPHGEQGTCSLITGAFSRLKLISRPDHVSCHCCTVW